MKHLDQAIKNLATSHDRAALEAAAARIRSNRRGGPLDTTLALEALRIGKAAQTAATAPFRDRQGNPVTVAGLRAGGTAPAVDADAARRNLPTLVASVRRAWAADDVAGASKAARIAAHAAKVAGLEIPDDVAALGNGGMLLPGDVG